MSSYSTYAFNTTLPAFLADDALPFPNVLSKELLARPTLLKANRNVRSRVFTWFSPGPAIPVQEVFIPQQRMGWTGAVGVAPGVRTSTLTPKDGGVEFAMHEDFSGLMTPLITRSNPDLELSFDEFATARKRRAEQGA